MEIAEIETGSLSMMYGFSSKRLCLALVADGRLSSLGGVTGCREVICSNLKSLIIPNSITHHAKNFMSSPHLLVLSSNKKPDKYFEKECINGLKILNMFSEQSGIDQSSLFRLASGYPVTTMKGRVDVDCFAYRLPTELTLSPQIFSLAMLMIRSGKIKGITKASTLDEIFSVLIAFSKKSGKDSGHIRVTLPYWHTVLKNREYLFGKATDLSGMIGLARENYKHFDNFYTGMDFRDGIRQLCRGRAKDAKVVERFQEIKDK